MIDNNNNDSYTFPVRRLGVFDQAILSETVQLLATMSAWVAVLHLQGR
jgi:hypothetical protein